jgi:hypothetical protein
VGDGSASTGTLPFVFLVTDGTQDNQTKGVPNGGWGGSNHATVLNDAINNTPNIPPSLQACASPNFFFTANTPADITTALNAMFQQTLVTTHITN